MTKCKSTGTRRLIISAATLMLVTSACGQDGTADNAIRSDEQTAAMSEDQSKSVTKDVVDEEASDGISSGMTLNDDGSYTVDFTFDESSVRVDFAGIDVFDSTPEYPRERFEEVFLYSRGAYLGRDDVDEYLFNQWGYTCYKEDCKTEDEDPDFGYSCTFTKTDDEYTCFSILDTDYSLYVGWKGTGVDKGIEYQYVDVALLDEIDKRKGNENVPRLETKTVLAKNPVLSVVAKDYVDALDDGLYDKVMETLPDGNMAMTPLFRFENGIFRAYRDIDTGVIFDFYLPKLGRTVYELNMDEPTGKIWYQGYRELGAGEDFLVNPAGREAVEADPIAYDDPYADQPDIRVIEKTSFVITHNEFVEGRMKTPTDSDINEYGYNKYVYCYLAPEAVDSFSNSLRQKITEILSDAGMIMVSNYDMSYTGAMLEFPVLPGGSADDYAVVITNMIFKGLNTDPEGMKYQFYGIKQYDNGYVVRICYDYAEAAEHSDVQETTVYQENASSDEAASVQGESPTYSTGDSTGLVITEEEFRHGTMSGGTLGEFSTDEFATGLRQELTDELNAMGAIAADTPDGLLFRRVPIREGTDAITASDQVIMDVYPSMGFDMSGKNYYLSSIEKFDNGYVVCIGWTKWN